MTLKMIYKDFISNKKLFAWWLAYIVIFSFVFSASFGSSGGFSTIGVFVTYLITGSILQNDEKCQANMLVGILPVNRAAVVRAKFILADLGFLAVVLIYGVFVAIGHFVPVFQTFSGIDLETVAAAFLMASLFTSANLVIGYHFDAVRSRVILMVALVLLAGIGAGVLPVIFRLLPSLYLSGMVGVLCLAGGVVIQMIGYFWAVRIYEKKDF